MRVGGTALRQSEFRNLNRDRSVHSCAREVRPKCQRRAWAALQLQRVVVDEDIGRFDQGDIACQSAVVPPIGIQCWDAVTRALVVDANDREVIPLVQQAGDFTVERGESAFVVASLLAIHPKSRNVIRCADM